MARIDPDDDDALLKAAGEGSQTAFNRLVQRHAPRLHAVAQRYGCTSADADEIVQDVFWRVWKHSSKWQPGAARASTWLYRLAVNRTIDSRRATGRRPEDPIEEGQDFQDHTATVEQVLDDQQQLKAMRSAISRLPDRQRLAIILSTQQEKSNFEIAEILGISEGAVEQLLVRARRTLRESYRSLT
ncbi:MAG: sigma-70 family RNA polymerase sigma factor [Pseudomonadota bacterium]